MSAKREWHKSQSFLESFQYALKGMGVAWGREMNFRRQLAIGGIVFLAALVFQVEAWEWAALILVSVVVITLEIINLAIEDLSDIVYPDFHPAIQRVKDSSAAAVLIASFGAACLGILIFLPRFLNLLVY